MVIVETKESNGKRGPKLLVDLRNSLVFILSSEGTWDKVPLKSTLMALEHGRPLNVQDTFGQLEGLIVVDATQHYRGPHPEGGVRCSCGAHTDENGFCPRCHDDRCHVCNKPLTVSKVPSGEGLPPREIKLCKTPAHNPMPVPHWRTKPIEAEPLPKPKPKKWPDKFKELPAAQRKAINKFFSSLMGIERLDLANWADECQIQQMPKFVRDFKTVKGFYDDDGPLPVK